MRKAPGERIGGSGVFLFSVIAAYLILGVIDPGLTGNALLVLGRLTLRIVPVLVLVFSIMFLANLLLDPRRIEHVLGEESGLKGWLVAISGGIISSGPIYMWYPILSDLKERGMKDSLIAAFLYNRAVKIPLVPMMAYYFGWPFTLILYGYMILFSVVNGIVVERLTRVGNQ